MAFSYGHVILAVVPFRACRKTWFGQHFILYPRAMLVHSAKIALGISLRKNAASFACATASAAYYAA
jgi:hypothetical protein